ncbi:MAG: DUF1285 domain-containing protein [Alphaproteobacteria bacterium]|nr:MAG: DUF1285 domain-containing protein [Alphaproteobacteria bacterium]
MATSESAGNGEQKTATAEGLAAAARRARKRGPAPVHLWDPPFCGDLDMRIARDGTWYYLGTPIGRKELVELFSTIIRRDGDEYFLVTPVEKVRIRVDDAPFVAVDFDLAGTGKEQAIDFVTNVGERVPAGPGHPIRVRHDPETGEPSPYVRVRDNLDALIDRKTFYRLVDLGTEDMHEDRKWFGVWSRGMFFPILPAAELD